MIIDEQKNGDDTIIASQLITWLLATAVVLLQSGLEFFSIIMTTMAWGMDTNQFYPCHRPHKSQYPGVL